MRKPKPATSPKEHEVARKPRSDGRVRAPSDACGAPPPPPVFYRRSRPDIEIDAPFFHLHIRENR